MRLAVLFAGIACWGATVEGDRLRFHFVASELANLTFELDAMAGLIGADGEAYRTLWRRELRWDREDDLQLDRWKTGRQGLRNGTPKDERAPRVPWPPNYAAFYGQELGVDGQVRIAGFQARTVGDYGKRLRKVAGHYVADRLVSVVKHFGPRFHEFWEREGRRLIEPKAESFARLVREHRILPLAERFVAFTEAQLPKKEAVWFYLVAHPTRFGRSTMATMLQSHAPVELLDEEEPRGRLSVIVHELVHHFYDSAPLARHLDLIEEFRGMAPPWRMAAYSYLNEAVATAAQLMVERRMRTEADFAQWSSKPKNIYAQPWVAALGSAAYPLMERCLDGSCGLFSGFAARYLAAVEASLGIRVEHPHFRLASRVVVADGDRLRSAARLFRDRVPSIAHISGWAELERFSEVPVVVLALEGDRDAAVRRVGAGRQITVFAGATPEAVDAAVERFALLPF